jgi:hypothetical protein
LALKCYFRFKDRANVLHPEIRIDVTMHREDEISEAFPAVEFRSLKRIEKETCSVCLDDFVSKSIVRRLSCNHIFHQKCIDTWIRHHTTCCLCKQNVFPEATESSPYPLMNTSYSSTIQLYPPEMRSRAMTEDSIILPAPPRLRSGSVDVTILSQIQRDQDELFHERQEI